MNFKLILYISVFCFAFASCSDFLDEENLSNVTAETFYLTEDGYESLVNANYSQLREIYGDYPWLFCSGTDLYAEGRDPEPVGLSQYTSLNASSQGVDYLYNICYEAIQSANLGLYYADLTEQTPQLPANIGEIKFLRANAYFLLVQTYGGVALVTDYISSPVLAFDRNSAEEVYDFIIAELEEAQSLVNDGSYNGRVNKRAVTNLLAKVHLTRGYESFGPSNDFETAAAYADEAIAGQGLNLSFSEVWEPGNEMNEEVIFSVQFSSGSISTGPTTLGSRQNSFFSSYLGGSEVAGDAPYRTYNLCPTAFAVGLFTEDDSRWDATFMTEVYTRYYDYFDVDDHSTLEVAEYYAPQWANDDASIADYVAMNPNAEIHRYGEYVPSANRNFDYETIPVKKFDDPTAPFGGGGSTGRVSTRDIIIMRLAETYLTAAEAHLMAGNASAGLDRLNVVRERAGVQPASSGEFNIDFILDERGRELLGEYHRWFDLKRTGKLVERASAHHYLIEASNFQGANGELKILRPIPQGALDLNQNKNFPQNPAYN